MIIDQTIEYKFMTKRLLALYIIVIIICSLDYIILADTTNNSSVADAKLMVRILAKSMNKNILEEQITLYPEIQQNDIQALSNRHPVIINFCDAHIKDYCATPNRNLQLPTTNIEDGIIIEPKVEGQWRFHNNKGLIFTPKESFQAHRFYKIKINTKILPTFVVLTSTNLFFQTSPLMPIIKEMKYLQDEGDVEKKFVQTKILFNYPIDPNSIKEKLVFSILNNNTHLPFTCNFNTDNTELVAIIAIKSLLQNEQILTVNIKEGLKPLHGGEELDYKYILSKDISPTTPNYSYKESVLIPSIYSYLKITDASINIVKNDNVNKQILVIKTNAPTTTLDIKKHLQLLLLPKNKTSLSAVSSSSISENYVWQSVAEITLDVINQCDQITFEALPSISPYTTSHSFNINTLPNRYLLLKLKQGLKSYGDLILGQDYSKILAIPDYPKEIGILPQGIILPIFGDKKLSIYSLGIDNIHVEIDKISSVNINFLISQTNQYNIFQNPIFKNDKNFNEYNIAKIFRENIEVNSKDSSLTQYSIFDLSKYLDLHASSIGYGEEIYQKHAGIFLVKVSYKDTPNLQSLETRKLILVTDLDFLVKTGLDGRQHVFVSSISTGKPLKHAQVSIIGLNGQIIHKAITDSYGHAILPKLQNLTQERTPTAYIVTNQHDLSFIPYNSRLKISGILPIKKDVNTYLFSDKGVYHRGEKANIGIICYPKDQKNELFLEIRVIDPSGQIVDTKEIILNKEGLVDYSFQTTENSQSGIYTIALYNLKDDLDNYLSSLTIRIEDFIPNKMNISVNFGEEEKKLWVNASNLDAIITLDTLYGGKAINRKITTNLNISPGYFSIPTFQDYNFYNAKSIARTFDEELGDVISDDQGIGTVKINLEKYLEATYRLIFYAKGFEQESGRSSTTEKSILISPLPYIIGFKSDTDLNYLKQQSIKTINFIAIDASGNKIDTPQLELQLKKIDYAKGLVMQADGSYAYQQVELENLLSETTTNITKSGYSYTLPTAQLGTYILCLLDKEKTILSKIGFSVVAREASDNFTNNNNISVKLDKDSYRNGEDIAVSIESPHTGYGLITIETDKVNNFTWFTTKTTNSVQKITIPNNFEGKGFVNVHFIKSMTDSKDEFVPPFSTNTIAFTIDVEKYDQKIKLDVPTQIKPGQELSIGYSTKKLGKILIFAIDEGILLYNDYKTPNPINYFFKDRTLQVTTSYITEHLTATKFSGIMMGNFTTDSSIPSSNNEQQLAKKINPFKRKDQPSVAFWSGVIDSRPVQQKIKFNIPDYFNGSLRIIAIASSEDLVGSDEANVLVQGDFIINPTLPLFVTPMDEFIVPITIANHLQGSGINAIINLNIIASDELEIFDYPKEILVSEGKEQTIQIKVKVKDKLGSANIKITASSSDKLIASSTITSTTSVRPATPNITTLNTGYSDKETISIDNLRKVYQEFSKIQLSVSSLPLTMVTGFKEYLDNYPYGGTEQLISKNFLNVILSDQPDLFKLLAIERTKLDENFKQIFAQISEKQNKDGSFNVWGKYSNPDDFVTVYVTHFLTEAASRKLPVPDNLLSSSLDYLKNMVNKSSNSLSEAREKAYAIYVLTRNNQITTDYINNIISYLEKSETNIWHNDLLAIYLAASYEIMQMKEEANKLLKKFNLAKNVSDDSLNTYNYYDKLIKYSQYLYIIATHFPKKLKKLDQNIMYSIANIANGQYNSLTSSYAIMASVAFATNIKNVENNDIKVVTYQNNAKQSEIDLIGDKIMVANLDNDITSLKINATKAGFFYQISVAGFDKTLNNRKIIKGVEVIRKYLNSTGKEVSKVKLGDIITVSYNIRSVCNVALNNMLVVDLFPGGFELISNFNDVTMSKNTDSEKISNSLLIDQREDRIVMFGTIPTNEIYYQYNIRAVNKGVFISPAVHSQSMYNPNIYYRGVTDTIIVE